MDYIRSLEKPDPAGPTGCFLCDAAVAAVASEACEAAELRLRLVLWSSLHCIVLMNKFPYTSGHLLVSPKSHLSDLHELTDEQMLDLQKQTTRAIQLLKLVLNPQGFNVGINIGRVAGAGLPGHLHQHVVPRWGGDANFMSVVGEIRIVPHALASLWEELMSAARASRDPG
jgi:ATP adenylyltransferase